MRRVVTIVAVLGLALGAGLTACKEKGPMEKAGEAVDEAVEDMGDAGQGAMERAGEEADEALEKAKEATGTDK